MSEPQFGFTWAPWRACHVVNPGCKAPPAHADSYTHATCFRCGNPVCVNCSKRRAYCKGRRRLCDYCLEDVKK